MKHITYTCDKCGKRTDQASGIEIDDGKVAALRRAGWTIKAIAEEIGCSQPTIIKHLKDMGVEKGDES